MGHSEQKKNYPEISWRLKVVGSPSEIRTCTISNTGGLY